MDNGMNRRRLLEFRSDAFPGSSFAVESYSGHESIGGLFRYTVELRNSVTAPRSLLGSRCALLRRHAIELAGKPATRTSAIHGRVAGVRGRVLEIRPGLSRLAAEPRSRIHRYADLPNLARTLMTEHGLEAPECRLGLRPARPWTTEAQRGETDFDFLVRLLERERCFFFFDHDSRTDRLVIADRSTGFRPAADRRLTFGAGIHSLIAHHPPGRPGEAPERLSGTGGAGAILPGRWFELLGHARGDRNGVYYGTAVRAVGSAETGLQESFTVVPAPAFDAAQLCSLREDTELLRLSAAGVLERIRSRAAIGAKSPSQDA